MQYSFLQLSLTLVDGRGGGGGNDGGGCGGGGIGNVGGDFPPNKIVQNNLLSHSGLE